MLLLSFVWSVRGWGVSVSCTFTVLIGSVNIVCICLPLLDSDEPTCIQFSYLLLLLSCMHIATLHAFQKVVGRSVVLHLMSISKQAPLKKLYVEQNISVFEIDNFLLLWFACCVRHTCALHSPEQPC